jgi:cytochrome P450
MRADRSNLMTMEQVQTIPVRKGWPLLGVLPELIGQPSKDYFKKVMLEQGGLVRLDFGPQSVYLVSHPDYLQRILRDNHQNYRKPDMLYAAAREVVGQGLVTSSGELWLRQRRMIQPHLHRKQLVHLFDEMREAVTEVLDRWEELAQNHSEAEMGDKMAEITINVITRTMFGQDSLPPDEITRVGQCAIRFVNYVNQSLFNSFLPKWFPKPKEATFKHDQQTMREVVNRIIAKCRAEKGTSASLIEMLIKSVDEDTNQGMTEQQLFDEVMTIFLAGYETTSTALTWLLVFLKEYPAVLEKLQAEIDQVLGGRPPAFEDILRLTYSQQVFMEVLRYHTVAFLLPRALDKPDQLGPYQLPANALVLLSFYGVHHNPRVWDHPETFDPERFTPEAVAQRHPFAYVPFSAGPRKCAGDEFALLEGPLIIAMLLQRYTITLLPKQTFQTNLGKLRPKNGVKATLSVRNRP